MKAKIKAIIEKMKQFSREALEPYWRGNREQQYEALADIVTREGP